MSQEQRRQRPVGRALVGAGAGLALVAVVALVEHRGSGPAGAEEDRTTERGEASARAAHEPGAVTIALAGEVHLEGVLDDLADDPRSTLGPMSRALTSADVAVLNLETAVSDGTAAPASKELEDPGDRYWFDAPPSVFSMLGRSGVDAVSMANNHGADYGREGLRTALDAAQDSRVALVGVGRTPAEAYAPYRTSVRGTDVAVLAADASPRESADRTWAIGPDTGVGMAAARRPHAPALVRAVEESAATDDVVVVYLHWGAEGRATPTPDQRTLAESLAGAGADVVVGSHAHVLLGSGMLDETYVSYGLGNFAWYHGRQSETGVLRLTVSDGEVVRDQWWPARIPIQGGVPQPLPPAERPAAVAAWRDLATGTGLEPPSPPRSEKRERVAPSPQRAAFVGQVRPLDARTRATMRGVSHRPASCPVGWSDLRLLTLSYVGFDGRSHTGRMVVHREIAPEVVGIFRDLYRAEFPIRRMRLVDAYGGDDDASMAADNTSAYNCRTVAGTTTLSDHAYGRAIDINPVRNPYVTPGGIEPPAGRAWADVDRSPGTRAARGVLVADDVVVRAFTSRGWEWGGTWNAPDYQHFSAG